MSTFIDVALIWIKIYKKYIILVVMSAYISLALVSGSEWDGVWYFLII